MMQLSVMFNVGLSISQYQRLHTICLPYTEFPMRNAIDHMKKEFHPPIFSQEIKSSVNLGELQRQTLEAISEEKNISPDTPLKMTGKFGLDGSGAHKIRHKKFIPKRY